MKKVLSALALFLLVACGSDDVSGNVVARYLDGAELQCECDSVGSGQAAEIRRALNDMLSLSPDELRHQRYADYQGHKNAWTVTKLLNRYFVPADARYDWTSERFYRDVSADEAHQAVQAQLDKLNKAYPPS